MNKITVHCTVNHKPVSVEIEPNKRLLDMLRVNLGLTSVKEGCSEGECGACTVIYNGEPVTSCCILAGQAEGRTSSPWRAYPWTASRRGTAGLYRVGAIQCGFCIPGMILTAEALLMKNPHPTMEQIKEAMSGNLCRCTGYKKIEEAVAWPLPGCKGRCVR